ncbi:MAG: SHOCT domain-containing protein [Solirubrobacterales bacterium]|nr:SHOCT domain-containing protein [Solirubrobacterales bacterium]
MTSDSEDKTTEQPPRAKPASDDPPTVVTPSGETPWQRSRGRRVSVHLLVIFATIFTILAVFANWTRQQLLDTDQWTKASSELIANPAIRDQLAIYLVDQLYTNVDVPAEIKSVLPKDLQPLAPVAAAGARDLITQAANAALEQPAVQSVWTDANKLAHQQFGTILGKIATNVGLPSTIVAKIPPGAGEVTVVQSNDLKQVQQAAKALKTSSVVLSVLAFLFFVFAVALAAGRRANTLIEVGVGLIFAGLAVVLLRGAAGDAIVSSLVSDVSIQPAATAAWDIESTLLEQLATQVIVVGVMLIIAGLIGGPAKASKAVRGWFAPVLNSYPEASYVGVALLVLLFLLWSPIPAASRASFIIIFIVLVFLGLYMLRRETLREFPGAVGGGGDSLRAGTAKIGAAFSRAGAAVKETTSKAAHDVKERTASHKEKSASSAAGSESQKMDDLERLVSLRDSGALSDEEFAAEKAKILGAGGAPSSS